MKTTVWVKLEVEGEAEDVFSAVDAALDAGDFQDAIGGGDGDPVEVASVVSMGTRAAADDTAAEMAAWAEYDVAAAWCAERGMKGKPGDIRPAGLSARASALIDEDPEAFGEHVRATAYARAMGETMPKDAP